MSEAIPAAPTKGAAGAVDSTPGMPRTVRLDDAVDLTKDQLITEGLSLADGCTSVYYTELTFADARTEIEQPFSVAGYTIDPTVVDEKGLYKSTLSPPASAGVQTKRRIVNIKQESDAAGVAMYEDKVRVIMTCYYLLPTNNPRISVRCGGLLCRHDESGNSRRSRGCGFLCPCGRIGAEHLSERIHP